MSNRYEYPFKSHYLTINNQKIHYIDEGQGPVIWMMHGMPMWSYVYRKLIPPLVAAGFRCFVPDLMGFGLSDKPENEHEHTLQSHVAMMAELISKLKLKNIVIVGQDWGGPISLRYALENKSNISGIILLNTFIERFPRNKREQKHDAIITGPLPKIYEILFKSGKLSTYLVCKLDVFRKFVWLKWRTGNPSKALGAGFRRPVDPRAMQNYMFPNSKAESRYAIAAFAKMIPNSNQHPNASYINQIKSELEQWHIPSLVIFPDGDMAWKPEEGMAIAKILTDCEFNLVDNAGHYIQEDAAEEVALLIIQFMQTKISSAYSDVKNKKQRGKVRGSG